MAEFWQTLPILGKIYWIVAIISTTIFFVLLVMALFGHDTDAAGLDADIDGDIGFAEGVGGFVLSFKSIMGFLMMFSWAGIMSMSLNISTFTVILISLVSGIIALFAVAFLLYLVSQLTYSGNLKLENSIGKIGKVYLKIPAKKQGLGKVEIKVQDTLETLDAMTEEDEDLQYGTQVLVVDITDENVLLVKKHI